MENKETNSGCGLITLFTLLIIINLSVIGTSISSIKEAVHEQNSKIDELIELQQQILELQQKNMERLDTLYIN